MKDVHVDRAAPGNVPVISPTLHCIALTAVVFLRRSFGYSYFRPRSIMFGVSCLIGVLVYIGWHEPDIWPEYRILCIYATAALGLYWIHFAYAFGKEWAQMADRETYSGTSHLLAPLKRLGLKTEKAELVLHLCVEPAIVLALAAVMGLLRQPWVSNWLILAGGCLVTAELMNYWTIIRRKKLEGDLEEETKLKGKSPADGLPHTAPPQPTRVAPQFFERKVTAKPQKEREARFAEILGLSTPFDIGEAEENYRDRIREAHPDNNENSEQSNRRAAELNEAIEHFRKKSSSEND